MLNLKNLLTSGLAAMLLVFCTSFGFARAFAADEIHFHDTKSQTVEFIGYESSIELTAEQEAIKKQALSGLPAPCCSENSAYTCCCPCNMARSIWGLSHYLIAEQGKTAQQVQAKVQEWIKFINPSGFSGNVCSEAGGCHRSFEKNGCGGMTPSRLVF